jgi:TRAP-type C4-dicarboxylate transport system permease large subunit
MKHSSYLFLILSTLALTGCEAIGDIFKAGVWTGVLLVILVIGIIVWFVTRSKA